MVSIGGRGESFLKGHGSHFPQIDVVIVSNAGTPEESRIESRGIIQAKSGQFDVDTPIYEGDIVEVADPRGGTRKLTVKEVNISDVREHRAFAGMSHISVKWGSVTHARPSSVVYNAPVVNVQGDRSQVAFSGRDSHLSQVEARDIHADYLPVAEVIREILDAQELKELSQEQREDIAEAGAEVLELLKNESPNKSKVRRVLGSIRSTLNDVATGASEAVGANAVAWAVRAAAALAGLDLPA